MTNTQRTLRHLRQEGRICGIVEKFNRFAGPHGVRQDLFGFIDIISLDPARGIVGVQSCGADVAAHRRKILEQCTAEAIEWLKSNGLIEIWGWRKVVKARGMKLKVWAPRVEQITLKDFD